MVPSSSTEGHCGKVGVVFVISPISVTDSAEGEHFFALALTDLSPFKIFFQILKMYLLRAFDCRLARLATVIGSRVRGHFALRPILLKIAHTQACILIKKEPRFAFPS